jgi:hypothetical protein
MEDSSRVYVGSAYRRKPVASFRSLTLRTISKLVSTQALTVAR